MSHQSSHISSDAHGLDRFFELCSDLLCVVASDGRFVRLSLSWEKVLGFAREEMIGRSLFSFIHPDDQASTDEAMQRSLGGSGIDGFTNRYLAKDGSVRVLQWNATPHEPDGLIFAVARDVGDEMRRREFLEEERARLQGVMDAIPDIVFIKDTNFRYVDGNHAAVRLMGHPKEDLIGRNDYDMFPEEYARVSRARDEGVLAGNGRLHNQQWMNHPENGRVLYDVIKVPFRDSFGHVRGLVGIGRDITEQARLRSEVDFLGAVVEQSRDALCCVDPRDDFRLIYANEAACSMLGRKRDTVIGLPFSSFDPSLTARRREDIAAMAAVTVDPVIIHTQIRRGIDETLPVEISMAQIRHGDRDYLVFWMRDVWMRRVVEARLMEREGLYRSTIEASPDGFLLLDLDGRILDANSAYSALSGFSVAQLRGMRLDDLSEGGNESPSALTVRSQMAVDVESRHRRADGTVWNAAEHVLHSDIEGGRLFLFVRDSARRRPAEALLRTGRRLTETARTGNAVAVETEALDIAEALTGSTAAFIYRVASPKDEPVVEACSTNARRRIFQSGGTATPQPDSDCSPWTTCLKRAAPLIANSLRRTHGGGGLPPGHPPLDRLIAAPLFADGRIVAVIGVGGKSTDYDTADLDLMLKVGNLAVEAAAAARAEAVRRRREAELAAAVLRLGGSPLPS